MKRLIFLFSITIFLLPAGLQSQIDQYSIGSLGGDIQASDGSVSFYQSMGDVAGTFVEGTQVSFMQGFSQFFDCDNCLSLNVSITYLQPELDLSIHPNPTSGLLRLEGDLSKIRSYELFNTLGRRLSAGALQGNQLDLSSLDGGFYLLCLKDKEGRLLVMVKVVRE